MEALSNLVADPELLHQRVVVLETVAEGVQNYGEALERCWAVDLDQDLTTGPGLFEAEPNNSLAERNNSEALGLEEGLND